MVTSANSSGSTAMPTFSFSATELNGKEIKCEIIIILDLFFTLATFYSAIVQSFSFPFPIVPFFHVSTPPSCWSTFQAFETLCRQSLLFFHDLEA